MPPLRQFNPFSKERRPRLVSSRWEPGHPEYYNVSIPNDEKAVAFNSPDSQYIDTPDSTPILQSFPSQLPAAALKFKKVDHYFSRWTKQWKYQTSASNVIPGDIEYHQTSSSSEWMKNEWEDYCFIIVRELPQSKEDKNIFFKLVIRSPYLIVACKKVMKNIEIFAPTNGPLEMNPKQLLPFIPLFKSYRDELSLKLKKCSKRDKEETKNIIATVDVLLDYYRKDYKDTLETIERLLSRGEITFDLLVAIFLPGTVVLTENFSTGELQAFRLLPTALPFGKDCYAYKLQLEGIDISVRNNSAFTVNHQSASISPFRGIVKISTLKIYPLQYHPRQAEVRDKLIERGRKWACLVNGVHHMHYKGTTCQGLGWLDSGKKYMINSRVMIDQVNYFKYNDSFVSSWDNQNKKRPKSRRADSSTDSLPINPLWTNTTAPLKASKLTDEDLLVTSPVLYGFSLTDKVWLAMNVSCVSEIVWDPDTFANLVIPEGRKALLQSLVEAHNAELGFDDFVRGKGKGLVVNLFGPTGIGKTYSAEAVCEHVKRPLYVIGAGDLGATATELDDALQRSFDLAAAWKALILIDEADVFLEKRGLNDLQRNAMVAVFLRHLEYYPAILFLTTNRVKVFDEAFLSRIHVALHFHELTPESLKAVWTAFIKKTGTIIIEDSKNGSLTGITEGELEMLSQRKINGRQVKNAVKTALSLAAARGEPMRYKHLVEVLDVTEEFGKDFESLGLSSDSV